MAQTVTATATFARFALLETQVRVLLRMTAGASDGALEKLSKGLSSPHYIEKVGVYGQFTDGTLGAALWLEIDWRQYALRVEASGAQEKIPSTSIEAVAPSLGEVVRTFNEAVRLASLTTEWVVTYAPHFDRDEVNRILDFSPVPNASLNRLY
jgi:hypothetical protein